LNKDSGFLTSGCANGFWHPALGRWNFSCGVDALDRYFQKQATQDVRRRATACYVATEVAEAKVAGYNTLAAAGVPLADMQRKLAKRLPR
jgi:hypothetical protein